MTKSRRYAEGTSVPVERTRAAIEQLLSRHGAVGFIFGSTNGQALIAFEMRDRRLRFLMPIPIARHDREQRDVLAETRRRYRALLLVLKAKLEAVSSRIVTFDEEFLAHIVVDGNSTVGDAIVPSIGAVLAGRGRLPPLLGNGES